MNLISSEQVEQLADLVYQQWFFQLWRCTIIGTVARLILFLKAVATTLRIIANVKSA